MKVELSKREIEVIINFMDLGIAFLATHGTPTEKPDPTKERISVRELMERLQEEIND